MRLALVTASARNVPALTKFMTEPGVLNITWIWPPSRSVTDGASPRYGTWAIVRPAIRLNSSPATWPVEPTPPEPILVLPGLLLAYAMNSANVLAGDAGFTDMMSRAHSMLATGAMSRAKLKSRLV